MAKENRKNQVEQYRKSKTSSELLRTIFLYINKIANEREIDKILVELADMGRDLVTADRCAIWIVDRNRSILWSRVAHGTDRLEIPLTRGVAGYVAEKGKPVITNNAYEDPRFDKEVDKSTGYITRNIIALPIFDSKGDIFGVFQVLNKMTKSGQFTKKDEEHLLLAATYTGRQLESAFLREEIEQTQREIILTLSETGEMRSQETGNHVKRVSEYCRLLAEYCGYDEDEVDLVKKSSPLHDIGKIAIPDSVLLKPGKLTPEEWSIMQKHTTLGYDMLKHSERAILKAAAVIAQQHHEKYDGSGYPAGLKGEEIHCYAMITAIADVFDALSSDRVYKKAWPFDKIIEFFREERGRHFAPELTDKFLANIDKFIEVKIAYKDELPE
ncbi:MAG: HD domain-containing protein [Spirochaetales bacterium]|nr:HD domain-containing protein [Spirochaetales bacterium]